MAVSATDPFAQSLAGRSGALLRRGMAILGVPVDLVVATRTRFIDDHRKSWIARQDQCQVVSLASGLCSRAYRLGLPGPVHFFEVNRRDVREYKGASWRACPPTRRAGTGRSTRAF